MSCFDDDTLLRFAQGHTSEAETAAIGQHLDVCADCRGVVAEAARALGERSTRSNPTDHGGFEDSHPGSSSNSSRNPDALLVAGSRVSRYEILEVVGVGGGGVVYRAYDPELERPIALKLIRPDASGGSSREGAGSRLQREARAMAQLSHPNVVNVYDTGVFDGRVFLVMELVEGVTLGDWLRLHRRPWRSVLEVFLEAGKGLLAAHAVGLVHRDFKPENVLVGGDGRPRVTDFGLARPFSLKTATPPAEHPTGARDASSPDPSGPSSPMDPSAGDITRFAGTPAYMAPEQFQGRESDARTDQFSFCVALYLALYGRHPFGLRPRRDVSLLALAEPVLAGRLLPLPTKTDVPEGVHATLARGLAVAPENRFPSFEALLHALSRWRPRADTRLRRIVKIATPIAAFALALAVGLLSSSRGREFASRLFSRCGNGTIETGEECDDGNRADTDACLSTCRRATCGDGVLRAPVEECDDGNRREGDGCSAACQRCAATDDSAFAWPKSGHCYRRTDTLVSQGEARALCARAGGDLATITSSYEAIALFDALVKPRPASLWIGLGTQANSGSLIWTTGETTSTGNLALWTGEPRPADANCFQLAPGLAPGRPYDQRTLRMHFAATACSDQAGALCEQPTWSLRAEDNHAYLTVSIPATWPEARRDCQARGSHLATIGSPEEQSFLSNQSLPVWIGASDGEAEGTFRWVDGREFGFRAFAAGEPDDPNGTSDCVLLGLDRAWHDKKCDQASAYICEVD